MVKPLTCGGLFTGLGGLELGLERAGLRSLWMAEKVAARRAVLHDQFPGVEVFDDVRGVCRQSAAPVDVVSAGFPCTNVSLAGDGTGLDGAESGLWREVIRVVRDLRPRYLFVENVAALLARGLDRVLGDLAASGYDAEWDCVPAAAVGAPHLRDRIWLVAYTDDAGRVEQRGAEPARPQLVAAQRAGAVPPDADDAGREGRGGAGLRAGGPAGVGRGRPRDVPASLAALEAPAQGTLAAALPRWRRPWDGFDDVAGRAAALGGPPEPLLPELDARVSGRVAACHAVGDSACPLIAEWVGRRIVDHANRTAIAA